MHEPLTESQRPQWVDRFVDEVLQLLPVLDRARTVAVAESSYARNAIQSPEATALAYAAAVTERLLGRTH